jgi:hypothetical protein
MEAVDLKRIESKIDLIIDAFGLSEKRRLAPCQIDEMVKNSVLKFQQKRRNKNAHVSQKS